MAHEDEVYYQQVAVELSSGQLREGLWTKALAKSVGDEALARSLYVEWRVQQLVAEALAPTEPVTAAYNRWLHERVSHAPTALVHMDPKSQALIEFESAAALYAKRCLKAGYSGPELAEWLAKAYPAAAVESRATDFRGLLSRLRR